MKESQPSTIREAAITYANADSAFGVKGRGRPEREPSVAARSFLQRQHFGERLRELREGANLTLSGAANLAGLNSPRKLAQYETTCYPPGDVVVRLAPHYGVDVRELAEMVLSHSDPVMFRSLTGHAGYEPSKRMIEEYLGTTAKPDAGPKQDI